eukprot:CAMPEP_0184680348 /NCGR_PEP_ID=MMETSP0312-20130426/3220_1 /TAXON_ID=31354 /ORGANISM="Compsopogon coeruleus, Strain SAG 36.94" /LENGTH=113 /DNA_ID=CAMNT_0027130389 /DNA_START=823 /DNA_END=1164 /DNA_ORIENTATION=-
MTFGEGGAPLVGWMPWTLLVRERALDGMRRDLEDGTHCRTWVRMQRAGYVGGPPRLSRPELDKPIKDYHSRKPSRSERRALSSVSLRTLWQHLGNGSKVTSVHSMTGEPLSIA